MDLSRTTVLAMAALLMAATLIVVLPLRPWIRSREPRSAGLGAESQPVPVLRSTEVQGLGFPSHAALWTRMDEIQGSDSDSAVDDCTAELSCAHLGWTHGEVQTRYGEATSCDLDETGMSFIYRRGGEEGTSAVVFVTNDGLVSTTYLRER